MHRSKLRSWIDETVPEPKRPGRKPKAAPPQRQATERKQTHYDRDHMPLHCMNCGRVYNEPHFGEVFETKGPEYQRIDREQGKLRGSDGAISDTVACNKRSCIDAYGKEHYDYMRHKYQDRDWTEAEQDFRQLQYENVRNNPEEFPEGFIDDVEPPL